MTYEAADQTARDMIAVHGRGAVDAARDCMRALLRCAEQEAVASWLAILEAIRSRGAFSASRRARERPRSDRAILGRVLKSGLKNLALKTLEVEEQGDLAFEGGEVTFDVPQKDGKLVKGAIKYVVVWKRTASGWQIHRDIWNDMPAR